METLCSLYSLWFKYPQKPDKMKVERYTKAKDYLKACLPYLEQEEHLNNLLIGIPGGLTGRPEEEQKAWLLSLHDETGIQSVVAQTPPYPMIIYTSNPGNSNIYSSLVAYLQENKHTIPGVIGPAEQAEKLATVWNEKTGTSIRKSARQMAFRLDAVQNIKVSEGHFRAAVESDLPLLQEWTVAFIKEAFPTEDPGRGKKIALQKWENKEWFVWENKEVVSISAIARPTRHGITLNYVYTPTASRGHGYASSCVAALSQRMLEKYDFCTLFTDMDNPTSNKIYQNIGYKPLKEFRNIEFH